VLTRRSADHLTVSANVHHLNRVEHLANGARPPTPTSSSGARQTKNRLAELEEDQVALWCYFLGWLDLDVLLQLRPSNHANPNRNPALLLSYEYPV